MKKPRDAEEQIGFALKQAETAPRVGEVCRKMGISEGTFYIYGLPQGTGKPTHRPAARSPTGSESAGRVAGHRAYLIQARCPGETPPGRAIAG